MNLHTQIELFGGPEDGREITLPVTADDAPLSPLPVPTPGSTGDPHTDQEVAWYERHHRRNRDSWVYTYANSNLVQQTESAL